MNTINKLTAAIILLMISSVTQAQSIQYMRAYDQTGINIYETPKDNSIRFDGLKVRFGAGFTQQFQNLIHKTTSSQALYQMNSGFNLAQANLNMDVQLADGIRLNLTSYLSARHHNESWVKGGYIQFDKLPFKGQVWDDIMKVVTIKIGHMEINYGDQHFRRSDGGSTLYNPFIENYITDAFATEIGGEIYAQKNGIFGMVGITNGTIKASIDKQTPDLEQDSSKNPAVYLKVGIDKKLDNKLRLRGSASYYVNNRSVRNTLYAGDRTGSNYWGVMEPKGASLSTNFTSGRFSPNFTRNISSLMLNGLVKYEGLEFFGTYETAKGSSLSNSSSNGSNIKDSASRKMNQYAAELIYRFGQKENVFIGARYNLVDARLAGYTNNVQIDRTSVAAGWFLTRNILLKGEYVIQNYEKFKTTDIRSGGRFDGWVIEAVVGF